MKILIPSFILISIMFWITLKTAMFGEPISLLYMAITITAQIKTIDLYYDIERLIRLNFLPKNYLR